MWQKNVKNIKKSLCVPNTTIVLRLLQIIAFLLVQGSFLFSQNTNRSYKITFSDTIPGFTSIAASGNVVVSVRQDQYFSITFKGNRALLKDVFSSIKVTNRCLNIDAGKLFENEYIYVDIIMPVLDTLRLYDNASLYTPTNIWLKRMYIENFSAKKSTIYINSNECTLRIKGSGNTELAGIVDILNVFSEENANVSLEFLSKYLYANASNNSIQNIKGKAFVGDFHAYHKALINASEMTCGRAKAFACDQSQINVKSEEKPLLLSLKKGKIQYIAPQAIVIDSMGIKNLIQKR